MIGQNIKQLPPDVNNIVAIGNSVKVTKETGVAIGSRSISARDKGIKGYDPNTNQLITSNDKTWKSKLAAFSVGNSTETRQITGIVEGSEDTDAVNVAQLKELSKYSHNLATSTKNALGGSTQLTQDGNITVNDLGETGKNR